MKLSNKDILKNTDKLTPAELQRRILDNANETSQNGKSTIFVLCTMALLGLVIIAVKDSFPLLGTIVDFFTLIIDVPLKIIMGNNYGLLIGIAFIGLLLFIKSKVDNADEIKKIL